MGEGGSTTLGVPWVPTLGQPWVATHPGWRVGDHKNWKIARKTMFVKGNHAYRIPCTKVPPNGDSHYINPCAMCYEGSPDPLYNVSKHCASSDGDSLPQEFHHGDFAIVLFSSGEIPNFQHHTSSAGMVLVLLKRKGSLRERMLEQNPPTPPSPLTLRYPQT